MQEWKKFFCQSLKATDRKAVGLIVVVHVAVATVEVQVVPVGTIVLRTTPVVAVCPSVVQRSTSVVEVTGGS